MVGCLFILLSSFILVQADSEPLKVDWSGFSEAMQESNASMADAVGEAVKQGTSSIGITFDPRALSYVVSHGIQDGVARSADYIANNFDLAEGAGEVTHAVARGLSEGGADGLRDIAHNMGSAFKENFGSNTAFSRDIADVFQATGRSISSFLDGVGNRLFPFMLKYGATAATSLFLVAMGYYGTKAAINVVQHRLMNPKPRVIIDSSKHIGWMTALNYYLYGKPQLLPMVFSSAIKSRLERISKAARMISAQIKAGKKNVMYRNLLLYGPPGTGKTMFAQQLAKTSGMEYAMVTGSSFMQPGAGIAAIDELFTWAKTSKKGLLIFIDEADSLLSGRDKMDPTSDNYKIVNHFLNYLGERNSKFMIVLATNYPVVFDEAMQRRIDDAVHMPLPAAQERFDTLVLYRDGILCDSKQNGVRFVHATRNCLHDAALQWVVKGTEGFSYADLQGIISGIKSEADISELGVPTRELVEQVVVYAQEKKQAFSFGIGKHTEAAAHAAAAA